MSKPPKPWAETQVYGGLDRIYRIWEDMRARNTDGYVPGGNGGGILANIEDHGSLRVCAGTTCSPFTATVIGLAFDPTYPRNDLPAPSKGNKGGDSYKPMFNGGKDPLPFREFYVQHNHKNQPIESIVEYGLGKEIPMKEMRRGDLLGIGWFDANRGGHAVWCWDVHLNEKGEVDAFQYLGANSVPWDCGVTIGHCAYGPWIKGNPKSYRDTHPGLPGIENARSEPVFKDEDIVVQRGQWLVLPGVPAGSVKPETFRVKPNLISYPVDGTFTVRTLRVGRLNYAGSPPAPFCMKSGGAAPMKGSSPGGSGGGGMGKAVVEAAHVVAPPPVVVPRAQVKKDADAPKKIEPKPAQQDEKKPLNMQLEVENALQIFFNAGWIKNDPGKPDAINDDQSKAAIKEYQTLFGLLVDGIVGKQTLGSVRKQLGAALMQPLSQLMLLQLFQGKKISSDPGVPDGKNHDQCRKAVEEFQGANELTKTGVPDADTLEKLRAAVDEHAPTGAKPGLAPEVKHLYWVGNSVEPGGQATLHLHANDLKVDQQVAVTLLDADGKEYESTAKIKVSGKEGESPVAIPKEFGIGAKVFAKVVADLEDDGTLEAKTGAPLIVRAKGGAKTETADWRPYIGKDAVPDEVLEVVRRNRALYPMKTFTAAKGGPANAPHAYEGPHKWNYNPPDSHNKWAKAYFQQKLDAAPQGQKNMLRAYLLMLRSEGRPASFMTYDNQIVTWGVGLGNKGNGVHTFENLNKDAGMKKLLDDLGIQFEKNTYHVVDLNQKKVVSSATGKAANDQRHVPPLESWRQQKDLMSAIIGMSEDPATREQVAEAMFAVYSSSTANWKDQDKIFTLALYFMYTHMRAWLPAIGKAVDIAAEFAATGATTPSKESDKLLAPRIANQFLRAAKDFFTVKSKREAVWIDVRTRTKTRLWKTMREDGKAEGFDPGEFTYPPDV